VPHVVEDTHAVAVPLAVDSMHRTPGSDTVLCRVDDSSARRRAAAAALTLAIVGMLSTSARPEPSPPGAGAPPGQASVVDAKGRPGRPREASSTGELRSFDDFHRRVDSWEHLSGDWGGARPWLHEHGVIPGIRYTVEVMSKLQGGATRDAVGRVLGNLDVDLTLDTEPLFGWPGGSFFFHFENLVGRSNGVNPAVGFPFNVVTNLNAPDPFVRMMSYYYRQVWLEDRLGFKLGKQDANVDFLGTDTTGLYLNLGVSPPGNIPMPTWPFPELGLSLFGRPLAALELSAGVYGGDLVGDSFSAASLFSGDVFAIFQIALEPTLYGRGGEYQIGAWLATTDNPALDGSRIFDSNYGAYFLFDQELLADTVKGRSLRAWLQFTWSPPDRNVNSWWVGGGVVWQEPVRALHESALGLGVYYARASSDLPNRSGETVIELFYKAGVTTWLALQPDLQYFVNPAGDGRGALVLGLRTIIDF